MCEYRSTYVISDEDHIKRAYIELLKIQDHGLRIKLNNELCALRDILTNLSSGNNTQEVQESYEEIALKERIRDKELIPSNQGGNKMNKKYSINIILQPQNAGIGRRHITMEVSGEEEDEARFNVIAMLNPCIKEDVDIIVQKVTLIG